MNKIAVTDEMEQRFCDYVNSHEGCTYRAALEAALNPPSEPEIKVTLEMGIAGQVLALEARNRGACGDADLWVLVKDIYRAMRKLEPKAEPEPFVAYAVPAPGQPWVRGLHYDWQEMRKWGSGSGSGNCDR